MPREGQLQPYQNTSLQGRIAQAAARFIPDKSVVFLGPGALTTEVIPFLTTQEQLSIITNALNIGWNVAQRQKHTLHMLGGQVDQDYGIYGNLEAMHNIRIDWIILEASSIDAERGITHHERDYANLGRALFALSAQVIILVAPENLGNTGALFIAPASDVDILITGREAPNPPLWDLSELGVRIVLA
jgi:DeoR/GlpR family transcriptional regulator of sugar metabolism